MGATGIVTASLSSWAASNVPATLVNYTCYNAAPAPLTLTDYTQCYSIWQARDGGLHYNYCLNVVGGSMNVFVNNYSTGQFAVYGFVCTHPMGGGGFAIANYSCPDGIPHQEGMCIPQKTYTLTLTPEQTSIEPSGTAAGDDKSHTQITVTLIDTSTNQPPDEAVQVKLIAHKPTAGGHDHDDPTRPRGSLAGKECTSDEPCHTVTLSAGIGSASVRFDAPIVSGTHTFTAQCDKCQGDATATLDVKVEGLEPIPASTFYALTESTGAVIGAKTGWHTDNHNLKPEAAFVLWRIAVSYNVEAAFKLRDPVTKKILLDAQGKPKSSPILRLNDASLPWGGVYDYCARPGACEAGVVVWDAPHHEHRRGSTVDVRANDAADEAIPVANFKEFMRLAADYRAFAKLESSGSNRHYHLRLLNRKE